MSPRFLVLTVLMLASPQAVLAQSLAHCFSNVEFRGWRAADSKTIYIRTGVNHYYRLRLVQECPIMGFPGAHLILKLHGSDTICRVQDFNLEVSQGLDDIPRPCIVETMTELSPSEASALPKKFRP